MDWIELCLIVLIFLTSIIIHENVHARVANYLGDSTAKEMGRFSFNPVKHMHPIGSLLPFVCYFFKFPIIGFAKPVIFNHANFKHPITGIIMTSISAPLTNFAIAAVAVGFMHRLTFLPVDVLKTTDSILYIIYKINMVLCVFNLLPIPPTDGSKIYMSFLVVKTPKLAGYIESILLGMVITLLFYDDECKEILKSDKGLFGTYMDWSIYWFSEVLRPIYKIPSSGGSVAFSDIQYKKPNFGHFTHTF